LFSPSHINININHKTTSDKQEKKKKGILDEGKTGKTTLIMLAKNKGVVVVLYL
jgi:hypothetical protein